MANDLQRHQINLELKQAAPLAVDAGIEMSLQVEVWCPFGCDLRGRPVSVIAEGETVTTIQLQAFDEKRNNTEAFALRAPEHVGEHTWSIVFPSIETEGVLHEEGTLPVAFRTEAHRTSLAVWDVPSPVVVGSGFRAKIGVKCSASCQLTGRLIEVRDDAGVKVGEGRLGETPWQETVALYWAEVDLVAPSTEQVSSWSVTFSTKELELPHEEASATFSFRAAKRPDHRVTIELVGQDTRRPIANAEVRLGLYVTSTDERGCARLDLPDGSYEFSIREDGYAVPPTILEVSGDATIPVEATPTLTKAEWEEELQKFKHIPWG